MQHHRQSHLNLGVKPSLLVKSSMASLFTKHAPVDVSARKSLLVPGAQKRVDSQFLSNISTTAGMNTKPSILLKSSLSTRDHDFLSPRTLQTHKSS